MTPAQRRTALDALGAVGSALARLDPSLDSETVAARLTDAADCVERSLRSMAGDSDLTGQALVRDLRQRNLLTLGQAHAIVEMLSARDEAAHPGYRASTGDIEAARHAVAEVERVVSLAPDTHGAAQPHMPAGARSSVPSPSRGVAIAPARSGGRGLWVAIAVVVLLGSGAAIWALRMPRGAEPADVREGVALMAQTRTTEATEAFNRAAVSNPSLASPHVYLARIARDRGDIATARAELVRALKLQPDDAVAQREMGALLLATGDVELASSFYARAIQLDTTDRVAKGFLGCALQRLGRSDEASRWLARAGDGEWSACARAQAP